MTKPEKVALLRELADMVDRGEVTAEIEEIRSGRQTDYSHEPAKSLADRPVYAWRIKVEKL